MLLHGQVILYVRPGEQHHAPDGIREEGPVATVAGLEVENVVAATLDCLDYTKRRTTRAALAAHAQHVVEAIADNGLGSAPEVRDDRGGAFLRALDRIKLNGDDILLDVQRAGFAAYGQQSFGALVYLVDRDIEGSDDSLAVLRL